MFEGMAGRWALATGAGFSLAFLSFIPVGEFVMLFAPDAVANIDATMLPEHLDPGALPGWLDQPTYESMYRWILGQHILMYSVFGLILGSLQWYALRDSLVEPWPWILAAVSGFAVILLLEMYSRHMVIGPHAGPLEPILIALGGGSLTGIFQWLYLRRIGVNAKRWLLLWIGGIVVGIAAAAATLAVVEMILRAPLQGTFSPGVAERVGWAIFLFVYGAVVGTVAGLVSGRRLHATLTISESPENGSLP